MPFRSSSQQKKCYSLKAQGKAGSWDCKKWSAMTNQKSLPKKATKAKKK